MRSSGAELAREMPPIGGMQVTAPKGWAERVEHSIDLPPQNLMASDRVRYVGEAFAVVCADSRYAAEDAIEAIDVEFEPLPAVVDPERAKRRARSSTPISAATRSPRCYVEKGDVARAMEIRAAPHPAPLPPPPLCRHAARVPGRRRRVRFYHVRDGVIQNGFTVVSWNLVDTGPAYGGFCCVPGSHKSNFVRPNPISALTHGHWEMMDGDDLAPGVVIPEAPAGSVVLFSEALTHGTAPWKGAHRRRTLIYKYCQSHIAWSTRLVPPPDSVALTPRQQILLQRPANRGAATSMVC